MVVVVVFQWSVLPLVGTLPRYSNFYKISVFTGMRRWSGTKSNIFFILSGETTDTGVRELRDASNRVCACVCVCVSRCARVCVCVCVKVYVKGMTSGWQPLWILLLCACLLKCVPLLLGNFVLGEFQTVYTDLIR